MSHHHYVTPPTEAACWSQPIEAFERHLRSRWPDARIRPLNDEDRALTWKVPMTHNVLVGEVDRNGTTIVLDGDFHDCIEVAIWFRALVPEVQPLIFFDEVYTTHVELRRGMTPNEIAAPFLAR